MSHRKLIRPEIPQEKRDAPARAVRRKQVPPEQTNAEEFYYLKQMAARTPMVVVLVNDEELYGWIEWYDKAAIKLHRHEGPNLLVPKHSIRYLFKEEELKRGRPHRTAPTSTGVPGVAGPRPEARSDSADED